MSQNLRAVVPGLPEGSDRPVMTSVTAGKCGLVISVCLHVCVLRKGSSGGMHTEHEDDGGPEKGHSNSPCGEL